MIDNEQNSKYRIQTQPTLNVRSKNDCVVTLNKHRLEAARKETSIANTSVAEPIYVNRMQNQSVNYDINNHINGIENELDYYNATDNDYATEFEPIINTSKVKSNYKLMGKPPSGEKYLRSFFGLSLDEREMPITRERSKASQANNAKLMTGDTKRAHKLGGSPKLLRASTCDAYPSRTRNR